MKKLREDHPKPLVYSQHFGVDPKMGKLESVHALTKQGARILEEEGRFEGKIHFCTAQHQLFASQYRHRKYTIDIQIAVVQYCERNQIRLRWYNYFEKESTGIANGYRSICSFPYDEKGSRLESDALFLIEKKSFKRLFVMEFFNDEKVIRVLRKLEQYRLALSIGNPSLMFGIESNAHIVLVFRFNSMIERVQKRLAEDTRFTAFLPYFHWVALEDIQREKGCRFWTTPMYK